MSNDNPWKSMNARQEPDELLLKNFNPIDFYWNRITPINEIIVGTSGSGKTAVMRMLSHSMLSKFNNIKARNIVDSKKFIGIYIPMLMFLGNINELNCLDEKKQQNFFIQAFNFMACKAFLTTIKSSIKKYDYADKDLIEKDIVKFLSSIWLIKDTELNNISELHDLISEDWLSLQSLYRNDIYGISQEVEFNIKSMSFFSPISTSIEKVINILSFPEDVIIAVLIDEAEFLSDVQKKEVNTLLRSEQRPFVFKIATLPYAHLNMETKNSNLPLRENQDFKFVSIDFVNKTGWKNEFISLIDGIIKNRLQCTNYSHLKLEDVFGKFDYQSYTIDEIKSYKKLADIDIDFLNSLTSKREEAALKERFVNSVKRDNKITNKYLPVFCTKKVKEYHRNTAHSKPGWFSGFNTIVKVSEGNIRRFINIMGLMFDELESNGNISRQKQHEILIKYAKRENEITRNLISEEAFSFMDNLIKSIEKYFDRKILVNNATSFKVDWKKLNSIKNTIVDLISFGRIIPEKYTGVDIRESGNKYRISYLNVLPAWVILRSGSPLPSPDRFGVIDYLKDKEGNDQELLLFDNIED